MIEVDDLEIGGTTRPRLRLPAMRLHPGHVYGLIGPNGAGKSSLMSVLAGLLPVERGVLSGLPWQRGAPVGAVFGSDRLHPGRTVRETLWLRAAYVGAPADEGAGIARRVGLGSVLRRRVKDLSLGMKMRLAVGVALVGSPTLVLLDEPMNGLDPDGIAWVRTVIEGLRQDGVTVVISSHLLGELEAMIDTAIIMSAGEVIVTKPMRDAIDSSTWIEVSAPDELLQALTDDGIAARVERTGIVAESSPAPLVRFAVSIGVDVFAVAPAQSSLELLYDATVSAEHIAVVPS